MRGGRLRAGRAFHLRQRKCETGRFKIGKVKRKADLGDNYFCYYCEGDTAACTPVNCMHKLANSHCVKAGSLGGSEPYEQDRYDAVFGVPVDEALVD